MLGHDHDHQPFSRRHRRAVRAFVPVMTACASTPPLPGRMDSESFMFNDCALMTAPKFGPIAIGKLISAVSCDRLHVTQLLPKAGRLMGARKRSNSSRDKVRAHRSRLRRQGLRPIQIWVPDLRSPAFVEEAHRQSLAVARSPHAREDQDFIDAITNRVGT